MSEQKGKKAWEEQLKKWGESRFRYLDVIVSSGKIRRLFFSRCKELEIDPYELSIRAGITNGSFKTNYIDNPMPECTKSFDQEKVLKMLELAGIKIKVSVILKPLEEVAVELKKKGVIKDE